METFKLERLTSAAPSSSTRPLLIGLCSPSMGSGKTTFAEILQAQHRFKRLAIASTLKQMTLALIRETGLSFVDAVELMTDTELKELPLPELGGKSPRYVMQTIGTEWGRKCMGEDFWITAAISKAKADMAKGTSIVIDDVRFRNEAQAIMDAGGVMVRIIRPGTERQGEAHASEGELDSFYTGLQVINSGTLTALAMEAEHLINFLRPNDIQIQS